MPKCYLVFDIEVTDPKAYERYRQVAAPLLARSGARVIVQNGSRQTLEGGWAPQSLFVLEFDSCEQARAFYFSKDYQDVVALRLAASISRAVLIEGAA